jgi:hypothetical protein
MPTAFMINVKMRYIHGFISLFSLVVFNYLIVWILTGSLEISTNMSLNMENTSHGLTVSIIVVIIAILAMFASYTTSKKLSN